MTLARGLDMSVTAEGVETAEEFERLKALGVNFAQGYLFGRPLPIDQIELGGPTAAFAARRRLSRPPKRHLAKIA